MRAVLVVPVLASTSSWAESELGTCGKKWVEGIAASPDGNTLAIVCEDVPEIRLQPLDGGKYTSLGKFDAKHGAIAWSADGKWIAVTTLRDDKLHIVDVAAKREVPGPTLEDQPHAIAFSPQGAVLAYDDDSHFTEEHVALYDVAAKKEIGSYPLDVNADSIAFSRDGKRLAFGQGTGKRSLVVIDLPAGTRHELVNPTVTIQAMAFSDPAGTQIWLGHDHGARLWDIASDKMVFGASGHLGEVTRLAYRPDGKTLASGSTDSSIRLWDLATGTSRVLQVVTDEYGVIVVENDEDWKKFPLSVITGLGWSPDGATLYETDGRIGTGNLRSWNVATAQQIHAKKLQDVGIKAFALSPDGKRGFSIGTEADSLEVTLRIVDADSGREIKRVGQLDGPAVAVSRDGKQVAVAGADEVLILDAATGATIAKAADDKVESMAFSADGTQLAVATYWGFQVFSTKTGAAVDHMGSRMGWCTAIAFTPTGNVLVGTYHGDVVTVLPDGGGTTREHVHGGQVNAIAVAPDGKSFASGGADGQILLWPL